MEKGCRRAGPDPVRPTRIVTPWPEGFFPQRAVTKISVWASHNRPLLPDSSKGLRSRDLRRNQAADKKASVLDEIEPMMHVPAGLEGRDYLRGHRDLGAIARISPSACVTRLNPEHAKAAQLDPISS